jgi:predicted metalloprotease with PDZ domain
MIRPSLAFVLVISLFVPAAAQTVEQAGPSYVLSFPKPQTHMFDVAMTITNVRTPQLDLEMPTWTPGSYLQREFERHVQDFKADDSGRALTCDKINKSTWRITTGASTAQAKTIHATYRVYANELATQTSHLDATHAYFNGASIFMYVPSLKDRPHRLKIVPPFETWRVTSPLALEPDKDGWFTAANYDRLVDSPTEVGTHRLLEFTMRGKTHRVTIWGDFQGDEERVKTDLAKIVEEDAKMFDGLLYDHYTFIVGVQPGIGGGTEHVNANVSLTTPNVFKNDTDYKRFLSLESHEYFHNINVKRIRPLALGPFDYQTENYTHNLWVSEGFTDYYGALILRRAGLTTVKDYLDDLGKLLAGYEQTPGRLVQSAESASFDAWIKQYRPDESSVNTAMSYYTRGDILGMLFDIEIRTRSNGTKSLDDVMRLLLDKYGLPKPGFTDTQLKAAFETVAGGDLSDFWKRYVAGTDEIDFAGYLAKMGLTLSKEYLKDTLYGTSKTDKPGALGIRTRSAGDRLIVSAVLEGMPAYEGGVNVNDELAALNGQRLDSSNASKVLADLRAGQRATLTVFRREKLMNIELTAVVRPFDNYVISENKDATDAQKKLRIAWIGEDPKKEETKK